MEAKGFFKEAVAFLTENRTFILDKVQFFDNLGRIREKNGQIKKAIDNYESLLELNSANFSTYYKILEAKGVKVFDENGNKSILTAEQKTVIKDTLEFYKKAFPKVDAS